ncbi:MAG: tetratricopeptide repeat protein, partial [Nitrospirae bacterium]
RAVAAEPKLARAWLGKARVLARLGRKDEAAAAAAQAAAADPHLGLAYLIQARIADGAGERERAVALYRTALKQDARVELPARLGLGQDLLALDELKAAEEQGAQMVKRFPAAPHGYFVRGVARYRQKRFEDAVADLQKCLAKAPDHPGAEFYLALAQYQRKQWQQALAAAKALQAQRPGLKPVEMLLAELLLRTGDPKGAEKQARQALALAPDSAFLYRVLGAALVAQGKGEAGAEALEKAQELAPDEKLEFAIGDLYLSMNDLEKAAARFEAAAAAHPEDRGAQIRLFYTRLRQRDFDGALGLMDDLLLKQPGDPLWLNLKGAALLAKKDEKGAEATWRGVTQDRPELPAAHLNLAGLYERQKRWGEARKEYELVLAAKPKHSVAHRQLAVLDLREGKLDEAVAHLQASLAAQPDARVALVLSSAWLQKGDRDKAVAAADRATEIAPNLAAAWLQAGVLHLAQGDLKGGEARLRKATELDPKSAVAWYQLGGVAARQKRWDEARAHLK